MSVKETLLLTLGAVFAVLVVASSIGLYLRLRLSAGSSSATIDNLNIRIKAWWWMIGLLGGALWLGKWAMILLFAFISFQCLREFVSLTYTRRGDHQALVWSFFIFLPLQYVLIAIDWYGLFSILIPVYALSLIHISEPTRPY